MSRLVQSALLVLGLALLVQAGLLWGIGEQPVSVITGAGGTAGFLLLLPMGLLLLTRSAVAPTPSDQDPAEAGATALVVWAIATLAYFGAGFAFEFGGAAIGNPHPDFKDLYWNWSPLDESYGTGWGIIGLRGWALLGEAATPGVFDLFLRHVALLGVATVIPGMALQGRMRMWGLSLFGIITGTLIYPLAGNWVWSSGWLASLGETQGLGHGFVDAGIALPFTVAGIITLAAHSVLSEHRLTPPPPADFRDNGTGTPFTETPMPPTVLPLVTILGVGLLLWGWVFAATMAHIPTAAPSDINRAALNGILSALVGGLAAGLYSRFTTTRFNLLMTSRGAVTGLVLASTVAPFIPPWQALVIGGVAGLMTPLLIYFVDHVLRLTDTTAAIAMFGLAGPLAWLLPGLLADGTTGVGWNNIGLETYLAVEGQGVSGLIVATGYLSDWPGQFNAQLVGMVAVVSWVFLTAYTFFKGYAWVIGVQAMRRAAMTETEAVAPWPALIESEAEETEPVLGQTDGG